MKQAEIAVRRIPLGVLATTAMIGICLADQESWFAAAMILGLGAGFVAIRWTKRGPVLPLFISGLICFAAYAGIHHDRISSIKAFPLTGELAKGDSIEIQGSGWIADRVDESERSTSSKLQIDSIRLNETEVSCDHRVPVWIDKSGTNLQYGQRIEFTGLLQPLERASAPDGFDPAGFYFRESGSLARLEIREGDELRLVPGRAGSKLIAVAQQLRDYLEEGLFAGLSTEQVPYAKLIAAMSLGARENTPEDLEESFRRSGTMHLFAVSGLHVGVIAGLLFGTLLLCRLPRRTAVLIVIPLVLFYAVLTGLRPSAIRAALMLSVILASFAVKEKPNLLNSLALAALLILGFDTQQLFLPGFQLSFAVLLFIALFAAPLQNWISLPWLTDPFIPKTLRTPLRRVKDQMATGLATALAVSLVSWLGSLGLLVWHFQSFAPVGVLANIFMVPLASLVVSLAAISLASFSLHGVWLSALINQVNVGLTILLTSLAQMFGSLPGAYQNSGGFSQKPSPAPDVLTLDVMSERGGSAMLLEFPKADSARQSLWMIDPGGSETYRRQMLPVLRSRGINLLDALILTHGDVQHIGETSTVLSQFRPRILFESSLPNRSPVYPAIDQIADALPIQRVVLKQGQRLRPHPNTTIRILAPTPDPEGRLADDRVLVLKLQYGDMRVLMTSDAGFETEKQLLESGVDLNSEVWIRGQHLESPSGLPAFVEAISPQLVISTSAEFPTTQIIPASLRSLLTDSGIPLLELNRTGVVTLSIQPHQIEVEPFATPERRLTIRLENFSKN
ncbi:MAG: ComEC/Rec2 family competence protein [Verrucomicrobiales bacterium]|nr:ComEC/Rec2 family competence protein [Verrucomicrobiales bacterium]